jgi:acyl transferase domain-containing protein
MVNRLRALLREQPEIDLRDICHTANTTRKHFKERLAVVAPDTQHLLDALNEYADDNPPRGLFRADG